MHAGKGAIVALLFFAILVVVLPQHVRVPYTDVLLTVSAFSFLFVGGFFLSRSLTRYWQIREHIATEDAYWHSVYESSAACGDAFVHTVRNLIDEYIMRTFDLSVDHAYHRNASVMARLCELLHLHEPHLKRRFGRVFHDIMVFVSVIEEERHKAAQRARLRITRTQWFFLLFLAAVLIVSLLSIPYTLFISQMLVALLCTGIVSFLLLLRDLNNLRLSGRMLLVESGQKIFDALGRPGYYHKEHIRRGFVSAPTSRTPSYRLGIHRPGEPMRIRLIHTS